MAVSAGGSGGGGCFASSPAPFCLLEVTVISAQDLLQRRFGRRVRAYAVAWADNGEHRLATNVDLVGGADPTWNDRFVFRVDPEFMRSETAAVTVEVRRPRRLFGGDAILGSTRIVVSTFVRPFGPEIFSPSSSRAAPASATGRQVAALQIRRPRSLRPQGILNVAVTLLDAAQARAIAPICGAPGSPDAFSVKDLPGLRSESLCRIADGEQQPDDDAERHQWVVENSGPLDPKGAAVEQSKLEMTLKKWRADLSPDHTTRGGGGKRRRRRSSCFGGP